MPGISGLGSSCSGNLCRLTLLSWSIAPRLRMRTGTLAIWPNLRGVAPLFHPGGGRAGVGGKRSRRLRQGARASSSPSPAPPAQTGTDKTGVVNCSWGFQLLCVSSTVLKSWWDALLIHSSGISKGTQVSCRHPGFCSCLRENTSFAEVRAEERSMPEQKSNQMDMKNQQPLRTSYLPDSFSALPLTFLSLVWDVVGGCRKHRKLINFFFFKIK